MRRRQRCNRHGSLRLLRTHCCTTSCSIQVDWLATKRWSAEGWCAGFRGPKEACCACNRIGNSTACLSFKCKDVAGTTEHSVCWTTSEEKDHPGSSRDLSAPAAPALPGRHTLAMCCSIVATLRVSFSVCCSLMSF